MGRLSAMVRSLVAGAIYFVIVFAIAFAFGAARVTFLAPAVGPVLATLVELPCLLSVSWAACGFLVRRCSIRGLPVAMGMAATAFVLLIGAETAFSVLVFSQSIDALVASYRTPQGVIGLLGQLAFGVFPVIRRIQSEPQT